ncbi:hypothetical protein [Streptomyces sp. NPDC088923]|uniref:hypothetical protein n=1 Tax=Streptomyces sp. NPDC088923 TaxID=3365913 RepID=UPI0037FFAA34
MYRTRSGRRALLAVTVSAFLVTGAIGCAEQSDPASASSPASDSTADSASDSVPSEGQIIGSWKNKGGDWITFRKGGRGTISDGAQLQLSELMEKADTKPECTFSWGIDTVPAGGDTWVSVNFAAGECGPTPGEFGLYYYRMEKTGELRLSPAVEFPKADEIYARSGTDG